MGQLTQPGEQTERVRRGEGHRDHDEQVAWGMPCCLTGAPGVTPHG
jgi:hypothetical protein